MQNTKYKLYYRNIIRLVASMIIKLPVVAESMNRAYTDANEDIPIDESEWRYYKHLSGTYHVHDIDMMITSLDTGEEIIMSIENLNVHKKTRSLYLTNSAYQDAVKAKYMAQTNLVSGILYPIPYSTAVNATTGTILYYDSTLIDSQETLIVQRIEEWINGWFYKSYMQAYDESNDLFGWVITSQMYFFLPEVIMDIRFSNIHTSQAHNYHIRNYLASNYHLDDYIEYMTIKQKMYLYRNLRYIKRNLGKQEIFDMLVEILFTERSLPAFAYDLAQGRPDFSESLYPIPKFIRMGLNFNNDYSTDEFIDFDIATVLQKESLDTTMNPLHLEKYILEAEELTSQSQYSRLPTKIIEVTAIDPDDSRPYKLIDVMLNQWIYYAATSRYNIVSEILNTQSGEEFEINTQDLVLLYFYSYYRGYHATTLVDIPTVTAVGVQADDALLSGDYIPHLQYNHWTGYDNEIDFFIKTQVYPDDLYITVDDFYTHSIDVLDSKLRRYNYIYKMDRYTDKLTRLVMFNLNYRDYVCDLNVDNHESYTALLAKYGIDPEMMSDETWKDMAIACLDAATLFNTNATISLSDIQAAMIGIFNRLTSYTTQVLKDVVSQDSLVGHPLVVNPGDTPGHILSKQNWFDFRSTIREVVVDVVQTSKVMRTSVGVMGFEVVENRDLDIQHVVLASVAPIATTHNVSILGMVSRGAHVEDIVF